MTKKLEDLGGAGRQGQTPRQNHNASWQMLYLLCEQPELGIRDIARRLELSIGMAQRVAGSLVEGMLVQVDPDSRRYSLGPGVFRLATAAGSQSDLLLIRCVHALRNLRDSTGETAALHVQVGLNRVIVAQVESKHNVSWRGTPGVPMPLYAGAASMALLIKKDEKALRELFGQEPFEAFTARTPRNIDDVSARLRQAREKGYALTFGDRDVGAGGVAAAVFNQDGEPAYAVSVYGPETRIRGRAEELGQEIRAACAQLSVSNYWSEVDWA